MSWNVPDDWNSFWRTCSKHGTRWHASEGECPECEREYDEESSEEETEEETEEDDEEQQRRDEKNGLYPDRWDDCN